MMRLNSLRFLVIIKLCSKKMSRVTDTPTAKARVTERAVKKWSKKPIKKFVLACKSSLLIKEKRYKMA